jgi:hypothetical protein
MSVDGDVHAALLCSHVTRSWHKRNTSLIRVDHQLLNDVVSTRSVSWTAAAPVVQLLYDMRI